MRILFILLFLFASLSIKGEATGNNTKVENIDLNIKEHEMAITFFQFSNAESTLIQGPEGQNIMVDAGGKDRNEVNQWLSLYNVKEISTIILTKELALSIEQLKNFLGKYNIHEVVVTSKLKDHVTDILKTDSQVKIVTWKKGSKKKLADDLKIEALYDGNQPNEGMDLALEFFEHRILLMNSFSKKSEEMLLMKNIADVSIVKLPKCSKEDSLSEDLINNLNPEIALVVDPEKCPPAQDLLHFLQETWTEIYSMKRDVPLSVKLTETNYEVLKIPLQGQ